MFTCTVLIGSDGLFDNIFMETITAFLNAHVSDACRELLDAVQAGDEQAAQKAYVSLSVISSV